MNFLKLLIKIFCYTTMGILLICTISFGNSPLPEGTLWNILLSSFFTSVLTTLLFPGALSSNSVREKPHSRIWIFFRILLHYGALCGVMIFLGSRFGWISLSPKGIFFMALYVALVYLIVYSSIYWLELNQAKQINQRLKEQYTDEE